MLSGEAVSRRLAAVLAADYSPLMEADEEGTLAPLKSLRRGLIGPKIARHNGRAVKATGDGALVELASAVEAAPIAAG
jgi:adenylate cyclase